MTTYKKYYNHAELAADGLEVREDDWALKDNLAEEFINGCAVLIPQGECHGAECSVLTEKGSVYLGSIIRK